ncbi:PIN domain-containing protein [Promicromonospora sp. NPDC057488]|uniref:PIN domain-containing protein n=1 Tax=Promicromonospora sp. NPDC057488 TaxID=3346147 RepID=UPI00366E1784
MNRYGLAARPVRIVLTDANVLYSRVLRDYLLCAADLGPISVAWSPEILGEMAEHLQANISSFTEESGRRLVKAMNNAFPYAQVTITAADRAKVAELDLPDEDDRHVLAATAEAQVLCTSNLKDFPRHAVAEFGVNVMHPDLLLSWLVRDRPEEMRIVHDTAVERLPGATDSSTVDALRRAGAPTTAQLMDRLLRAAD